MTDKTSQKNVRQPDTAQATIVNKDKASLSQIDQVQDNSGKKAQAAETYGASAGKKPNQSLDNEPLKSHPAGQKQEKQA